MHFTAFMIILCFKSTDAVPELASALLTAIRGILDPDSALKELTILLKEFDEDCAGIVGQRAFLIACNRGR